ncbi:MAG: ABC transporter ATP-binding protein [Alphaproteobacteria bacterium]|nr:MAG: ABC transporter ATP-binding protein [Alphaproteobacteria bacterium]
MSPLLSVDHVSVRFRSAGWWRQRWVTVLADVSLSVARGEMVALIGASGAGKSVLAQAVLGVLPSTAAVSGVIQFEGTVLTPPVLARLRGRRIALVPQTLTHLDPVRRIGPQLVAAARRGGVPADLRVAAVRTELARYGLGEAVARQHPHTLSGGMARRALAAMATVGQADLLLADEATTGLDPEATLHALHLLRGLADDGRGVLVITHDLATVLRLADRVVVLYAGQTVEEVAGSALAQGAVRHPYSHALWQALPSQSFQPLAGHPPAGDGDGEGDGCRFRPRCAAAGPDCATAPPLRRVEEGWVRCHRPRSW